MQDTNIQPTSKLRSVFHRIRIRVSSVFSHMTRSSRSRFFIGTSLGMIVAVLLVGVLVLPAVGDAQVNTDVGLGSTFGLGTTDLVGTIIRVVQWVLGLLGLIAVIMIMYGGFLWMTAGGNVDRIKKAKQTITRAVIGLIIILLAWAIVLFIVQAVENATNPPLPAHCTNGVFEPGLGETGLDCGGECPACGGGGPATEFRITDFQYAGSAADNVYLCSKLQELYNFNVNGATVNTEVANGRMKLINLTAGSDVPGAWTTLSKMTSFDPDANLDSFSDFQVQIPKNDITSLGLPALPLLGCIALGVPECDDSDAQFIKLNFKTQDQTDAVRPTVTASYPISDSANPGYPDRNVPMLPVIEVQYNESIDITTIIDAANPDHPLPTSFSLTEYDAQPSGGGNVVATYDVNDLTVESTALGFRVRLDSAVPLGAFTWYELRVRNVTDLCGNPMEGNGVDAGDPGAVVWEFETNDKSPGIGSWYPQGTNQCPDTHIFVTFNTTMYYNNVTISIPAVGIMKSLKAENFVYPNYFDDVGNATIRVNDAIDPNAPGAVVDNNFRIFELIPHNPLPLNSSFDVNVTTDMIIDVDGNTLSHTWNFSTSDADSCACTPYITSISPNQGLSGQCVTINGACFAGTAAHPATIPVDGLVFELGGTPFTATVGGATATQVTSTVPQGIFVDGDRPIPQVTIDYTDLDFGSLTSVNAAVDFFVNGNGEADGPCLYSISPTSGVQGQPGIALHGTRFNPLSSTKEIEFESNQVNTAPAWSDTTAVTNVHPNATEKICNQVFLRNDAGESNSLCFDVVPPPPDRWLVSSYGPPPCDKVCPNSTVFVLADRLLDAGTINTSTAKVFLCADQNCAEADLVDLNKAVFQIPIGVATLVWFAPGYTPGDWFRVAFLGGSAGMKSAAGEELAGTNYTLGGIPAFSWTFRIRDDVAACAVDSVNISPVSSTVSVGTTVQYFGQVRGVSACTPAGEVLDPTSYAWTWNKTDPVPNPPFETTLMPATSTCIGGTNDGNPCANPLGCPNGGFCNNMNIRSVSTQASTTPFSTVVSSTVSAKTGSGFLTVTDCETDAHCRAQCGIAGNGSTCNLTSKRCTPWVESVSPASGPVSTQITVQGCFFGSTPGTLELVPHLQDTNICGPAGWQDRQIIASVKDVVVGNTYPVRVTTAAGEASNINRQFSVTNLCFAGGICTGGGVDDGESCKQNSDCDVQCGGNVAVPAAGMPGICSITPGNAKPLDGVVINGKAIHLTGTDESVEFNSSPTPIQTTTTTGPGIWNSTRIDQIQVPIGSESGNVRVIVDSCPSNPIYFGIACSTTAECGAGKCCRFGTCVAEALCSTGGVGQLCGIPDNPVTPLIESNPNCPIGPAAADQVRYDCYSDTGDTFNKVPPPPEPPAFGGDCRVCCSPGQVSPENLDCFANQGDCTGTERGLYCGCTNDAQCGANNGCGDAVYDPQRCCHAQPTVTEHEPEGNIECTNQYVGGTFSQAMLSDSITTATIQLNENGSPVSSKVRQVGQYGFAITKDGFLSPGKTYQVVVRGGAAGVKNIYGVGMAGDMSWTFTTDAAANLCQVNRLILKMNTKDPPMMGANLVEQTYDIFRCQGNPTDTTRADDNDANGTYDCIGDQRITTFAPLGPTAANGNQHYMTALPVDANNTLLDPTSFTWATSEEGPQVVSTVALWDNEWFVTNDGTDSGTERVLITADGTADGFGRASTTGSFMTFVCDNPWPAGTTTKPFPFTDQNTGPHGAWGRVGVGWPVGFPEGNFSFFYCRDRGNPNDTSDDLPALGFDLSTRVAPLYSGKPNVRVNSKLPSFVNTTTVTDNLLKQFLFFSEEGECIAGNIGDSCVNDTDCGGGGQCKHDALGIRMYENYGYDGPRNHGLTIQDWYKKQFPGESPPESLEVDGYPAARSGRTVYVGAANYTQLGAFDRYTCLPFHNDLQHIVYLLSYPQNASGDTIEIYNRLLQSWTFNTNILGDANWDGIDDKQQIQRDMRRIQDIEYMETKLLDMKSETGNYPLLQGGSFISGMSTSRWPSWNETLGAALEVTLPTDPQNTFSSCPAGYDAESCWQEEQKRFTCADNSHIYQYDVDPNGQGVRLYASLEDPLNLWARSASCAAIPRNSLFNCSAADGSDCTCYNYQNLGAGIPSDREGPSLDPEYDEGSGPLPLVDGVTITVP